MHPVPTYLTHCGDIGRAVESLQLTGMKRPGWKEALASSRAEFSVDVTFLKLKIRHMYIFRQTFKWQHKTAASAIDWVCGFYNHKKLEDAS